MTLHAEAAFAQCGSSMHRVAGLNRLRAGTGQMCTGAIEPALPEHAVLGMLCWACCAGHAHEHVELWAQQSSELLQKPACNCACLART